MRLCCALILFAAIAGAAEMPGGSTSGAPLTFSEPQFEFGKVVSGNVVRHQFEYANHTANAVRIVNVEFGCDCSVAATWDQAVEPGEKGHMAVTMNTDALSGDVIKTITIHYAEPRNAQTILRMKGNIWPAIEILPRFATLGSVKKTDDPAGTKLTIRSNLEEPLTIQTVNCDNPAFQAELREVHAGREFELAVNAKGPLVPGLNEGLIAMETSYAKLPRITVPVTLYLLSDLEVVPRSVLLPPGPLPKPFERRIYVTRNGGKAVALTEATCSVEGVTVELSEVQPGTKFRLRAEFPANFQAPEGKPLVLTFKTDDPSVPEVAIPVTQARTKPTQP